MIADRLSNYLIHTGLDAQAGFSRHKGCDDAVTALKIGLQQLKNNKQDSYVLFIDIVKAFDSVNREMLWQILSKYGLPDSLIIMGIQKMYKDIQVDLHQGAGLAEFISTSGVKQGDYLTPILFLFVMQAIFDSLESDWPERPTLFVPIRSISARKAPTYTRTRCGRRFPFWRSL